jgi:hypothetical protein
MYTYIVLQSYYFKLSRFMLVRIPEFLILFFLGMVALSYQNRESDAFFIPKAVDITVTNNITTNMFNLGFAYPIQLDGHQCDPAQLTLCLSDLSSEQQNKDCCKGLQDVNIFPEETVPNQLNYAIIFGVTITVITLRVFFWRQMYASQQVRSIKNLFWFLVWWDSGLTLLIACAYTGTATAILKFGIGYPRPNYYALTIFASVHESDREHLHGMRSVVTVYMYVYHISIYVRTHHSTVLT